MTKKHLKKACGWIDYLYLMLIMALAVIVRSVAQFKYVFVGDKVLFREVDPYYQMRLAENMAHNGLNMLRWDYYAMYPDGANQGYGPVIGWITNLVGYLIGMGHPTDYLLDSIGAWIPPVAAGLVVMVVYFLGKEVFKARFVGILAALLVVIIPSELLHRSLLGFTDHHILEVLFSTLTILCLIKAIRLKNWVWGLGFILSFALYCINWIGWPLLASIIIGWAFIYWGFKRVEGFMRWLYFGIPLALIILGVFLNPEIRAMGMSYLSNVFLGFTGVIQEVIPTDPKAFYLLYGIAGLISFAGIYLAIKNKVNSLFLAWSIFFIVACIAEKRWGYYSTIGIALFAAYAIWWAGSKVKKDWKPYVLAYCCLAMIFATYPFTMGVIKRPNDISPGWYDTCVWLKANTPEPFTSPENYYLQNQEKASYGIFTWWDYGHWIIQISHRVPLSSPTQQESQYYGFFTEDSEDKANEVIMNLNIPYVIIDDLMAGPKYYAIWRKAMIGNDWQTSLKNSMVYRMYYGRVDSWKLIKQFGEVKIFGRIE